MHFRKYSFCVAIVCLAMMASSPTVRATDVTEIVHDSVAGSPLSNVTVFIVETGDSTVSDFNGAPNSIRRPANNLQRYIHQDNIL